MQPEKHEDIKRNRIRRQVIIGGAIILAAITVASSVSSFMIYRDGFADLPYVLQQTLALFAVVVVEGAFVWLVFGYTRAFTSAFERLICLLGMSVIITVMLINLVTHFMQVKGIPLQPFQRAWVSWGAIAVFIAVLLIVLCITLADPLTRIARLELRYMGKRDETIIQAKTDSLDSQRILEAMAARAEWEAEQLAQRIVGTQVQLPARSQAGFASGRQPTIGSPAHRREAGIARDEYDRRYGINQEDPNA
jgi:hypothetical protein